MFGVLAEAAAFSIAARRGEESIEVAIREVVFLRKFLLEMLFFVFIFLSFSIFKSFPIGTILNYIVITSKERIFGNKDRVHPDFNGIITLLGNSQ